MKIYISFLLVCLPFAFQESRADSTWEEEDGYLGVQFSVPLESGPKGNLFAKANYNILLINSTEGYADGFAIGFDKLGFRSVSYLRPSNILGISESSVRDHSITLLTTENDHKSPKTNVVLEAGTIVMYGIIGIILLGDALKDFAEDLESKDSD